jgi:acetolactate synthase-1/2/3 large subunit
MEYYLNTKLSDYVFQFIADQGVRHVFMVPGGGAMHLNNSVGHRKDISYICNHHEQASAIAAEAYARVTNNLGVALVTSGPGGTNAVTGVAGAWLDSTPCLFISGQVKRADIVGSRGLRQLGVQEIDIVSIIKSITKYAITIMEPEKIRYNLEKAVYLAKSGRPGPVWVDIPLDVQAATIDDESLIGFTHAKEMGELTTPELDSKIRQVIELLNSAERPIILVGNGTRIAGAAEDFLRLVDLLNIPVLTTRLGVDMIPADHQLSMSMPGSLAPRSANFALQNSDFLLILGARLDMGLIAYAPEKLARGAKKIMVNIDNTDMKKLGTALDVAVTADARRFILGLLENANAITPRDRSVWLGRCQEWKGKYPFILPKHRSQTGRVSVYAFTEIVSEELGGDCIILPGNAGNASELFLTAFKAKRGQRIFHNKGTGAMGFCQPAAIGACLASGGKLTICVDGDGGFQMNIQELETVRMLDLPIKFFVMNNDGYASIRASQMNYFGRLTGADATSGTTLPDIVSVARAYGLAALRIEDSQKLREQVRQVLTMPGPVVCDVMIIQDEPRAPRISSRQRKDGSIVSTPLEDMAPFLDREEFLENMIVPPLSE